ncbi:heavy-metal-associated domain-containing protein [Pseudarthrobacter sp. MDT3-26]|uniref:heavy-metal-associated domain-containing protein n=1 Tax=Pseudarthrobacter raffinosi TaxID=2953651 RepID=UPI00208FF22A|nr:heavy-metal-associated domain-containing protein [Pseudarthrobacter sp. MDT3-26]MCO4265169.1 heavy-metal-associated domain-containing protein [Pseudarthrobacter sp. MDT3-26]
MCGPTESRTPLPLASAAQHGCSCCSPAADTQAGASATVKPEVQASGAQYALEGLTCGHCVQTVEKAVSGVSGVQTATVDLVPGGTSRLIVTGTAAPDALAKAIRSSGYALAGAK